MDATNFSKRPSSRTKVLLLLGVAFSLISATVIFLSFSEKELIQSQIDTNVALIIFDEVSSTIMLTPFILLITILALLIEVLAKDFRKREKTKKEVKAQKLLVFLLFASIPVIILAGAAINSAWHQKLGNAGYSECDTNILMLSKRFTNSAWVTDLQMCYDEEARAILLDSHSNRGFEHASDYLENAYRSDSGN